MPTTYYHTVNGRTIGETTDGVRTDYLTDALGSVTATVDQSQNVLNTYRYKPYGGLWAKTGSSPDPRFLWTGDTGSRTTGLAYSEQYNRARHYGSRQANWTSVDPLWPGEESYAYVDGNPASLGDPTGMDPNLSPCRCIVVWRKEVEETLSCKHRQTGKYVEVWRRRVCFGKRGHPRYPPLRDVNCQDDCCELMHTYPNNGGCHAGEPRKGVSRSMIYDYPYEDRRLGWVHYRDCESKDASTCPNMSWNTVLSSLMQLDPRTSIASTFLGSFGAPWDGCFRTTKTHGAPLQAPNGKQCAVYRFTIHTVVQYVGCWMTFNMASGTYDDASVEIQTAKCIG